MSDSTDKPRRQPLRSWSTLPSLRAVVPSGLLDAGESVVLAFKPSLLSILFFSWRTVVMTFVAAVIAVWLTDQAGLSQAPWRPWIGRIAVVIVIVRFGLAILQWACRHYILTDRRVIRIRGVLTVDIFQSTLTRLQNTFVTMTLIQRVLGLGDVAFATAGTGFIEAVWSYCRNPLAIHHAVMAQANTPADPGTGDHLDQQA